jgi:hypothetical protein
MSYVVPAIATFSFGRMSEVQPAKFRNIPSCSTDGRSADVIDEPSTRPSPTTSPDICWYAATAFCGS